MNLQPGDLFLTQNPSAVLNKIIYSVGKIYSLDNESKFAHAGIILDDKGTTFEALWTVKRQNLFTDYIQNNYGILVARNVKMDNQKFNKAFNEIKKYEGKFYPLYRLFLFLFPPLAKTFHVVEWGVCSELAAKFYYYCGLLDFWSGVMPSDLEDISFYWKNWEIIYNDQED